MSTVVLHDKKFKICMTAAQIDQAVAKVAEKINTDLKDVELEETVEAVLDKHGIFYEKSEVWIESENLYEVLYQMEV